MKNLTIVIPALNERDGITDTIQTIPRASLASLGYTTTILVVDNGSTDDTAAIARSAGAEVITEEKKGYGYAYKAGFHKAADGIIVTMDADGTYPVEEIPRLVTILEQEDLEFITTNRFASMQDGAMSFRNKLGNKILALVTKVLFWIKLEDPESGMWVFKKEILTDFRLGSNGWPFSHEIKLEACYFLKCRWKEVPIQYKMRLGETKLTSGWKVGIDDLFHIISKRVCR